LTYFNSDTDPSGELSAKGDYMFEDGKYRNFAGNSARASLIYSDSDYLI